MPAALTKTFSFVTAKKNIKHNAFIKHNAVLYVPKSVFRNFRDAPYDRARVAGLPGVSLTDRSSLGFAASAYKINTYWNIRSDWVVGGYAGRAPSAK